MIKLSNQQVLALVSKIKNELSAPIKEHNQKIFDSEEYKNFITTNEDCILYKSLSQKYKFDYLESRLETIRKTHFKDSLRDLPYIPDRDIENEIILATIDSENLQSLIKSVSEKFK